MYTYIVDQLNERLRIGDSMCYVIDKSELKRDHVRAQVGRPGNYTAIPKSGVWLYQHICKLLVLFYSSSPSYFAGGILYKVSQKHCVHILAMVKSTTIVRASDALPLAASVDDEEVRLVVFSIPS